MAITPCLLEHITLIEVTNGVKYTGPVNIEGLQANSSQGETSTRRDERYYFCANCLKKFDGEETFDECKKHLGTFPI